MKRTAAISGVTVAVMACSASVSAAREYAVSGPWSVRENIDFCSMSATYDGPGETRVMLIWRDDDHVGLSLSNSNWSIQTGEKVNLRYYLDDWVYGGENTGIGKEELGRGSVGGSFPKGFVEHFGAAKTLTITRGNALVDQVSLAGSAAGIKVLAKCVDELKRRYQAYRAADSSKGTEIPLDPFAKPDQSAEPKAAVASLFIADDYPAAALRDRAEGETTVKVGVGSDGRPTDCTVTRSSGSAALDNTTCKLILRRLKVTPAKDARGAPVAGTIEATVPWKLPN